MNSINRPEEKENLKKFSKFSLIGILNTLISFISYSYLINIGLFYLLASFISYCLGLLNSYIWNLRWTFQKQHSRRVLIRFIIVNTFALSFKLLLLKFFVDYTNLGKLYSEGLAIIFSTILNFFGNNFWAFRNRETDSRDAI
jgi:putative flippase GtrA